MKTNHTPYQRFLAFYLAVGWCIPALAVPDGNQSAPSMLELVGDPLLVEVVHDGVARRKSDAGTDGASASSREWLEKRRKSWAIEFQRGGGSLIVAGVVRNDHELVDAGLRMFEWGFQRQDPATGGFAESQDPFHSTSVFLMEVCRALLALRDKPAEFQRELPRIEALIPHARAAAHWFLRPEVLGPGKQKDQPYTHRKWLLAFALGGAAKLSGDRELALAAEDFAREGIALQQADGRNPERGGYDVSYQMVDVLVGSYYHATLSRDASADLMVHIEGMIQKSCQWEIQRILPNDQLDVTGSTRMGKDRQHNGKLKEINYPEVIQAFSYAARICRKPEYAGVARRLARGQGWRVAAAETSPAK